MEYINISIAKDFSITPGPRDNDEGLFSGKQFLEEILLPRFTESLEKGTKIRINLDGTAGFGTSFLEEVFGGLSRKYGAEKVLEKLEFISEEEPYLIDDINEYINDTKSESK